MQISLVSLIMNIRMLLQFLILASIVVSFLPNIDPNHPIVVFIRRVTDPLYAPFRNILPSGRMGLDFSPLFAMFAIDIVARILVNILQST